MEQANGAAAFKRFVDAMPDPPRAYAQPFDNAMACGLVVHWAAKGTGFGEITLVIDKRIDGDHLPETARVDTEHMGAAFTGRMFMAMEQTTTLAREAVEATKLLAVPAHETLCGAINNLRQHALAAEGNGEELTRRLRRCLQALREGVLAMDKRGSAREDWVAGAERVITECGVGVDDTATTDRRTE